MRYLVELSRSVNLYKQLKKCAAIGWAILLDGLFLIELHEFNILVWKYKKICLIFNKYFKNVLKGLKIQQADFNPLKINKTIGSRKCHGDQNFSFNPISKDEMDIVKKSLPNADIFKILKLNFSQVKPGKL